MNIEAVYHVPQRWAVSSYYTLSPEAPDGSGRVLLAAADLETRIGGVYVFDAAGNILNHFGDHPVESMFFHTGLWESWSPDGRFVYYQSGSLTRPEVTRRELATGREITVADVDFEGAPPHGEPVISGLPGMLYAAGYGYGIYNASLAPVPFEQRDRHGIFAFDFSGTPPRLCLSVAELLAVHPDRERLQALDRELAQRTGTATGLTLMAYCVRWSPDSRNFLLYFGNHCVDPARGEPQISHLFTCSRDFRDLRFVLDISGRGVHWSYNPDGRSLVGFYRPDGEEAGSIHRFDCATGQLEKLYTPVRGGGHPSLSPANPHIGVNDMQSGVLELFDTRSHQAVDRIALPCIMEGYHPVNNLRNEFRCCHHPVFTADGRHLYSNTLNGRFGEVVRIAVPEACR